MLGSQASPPLTVPGPYFPLVCGVHRVVKPYLFFCTGTAFGGTFSDHRPYAAFCPTRLQQRGHRCKPRRSQFPGKSATSSHHEADADRAKGSAPCDGATEATVSKGAKAAAAAADPGRAGTVALLLYFRQYNTHTYENRGNGSITAFPHLCSYAQTVIDVVNTWSN